MEKFDSNSFKNNDADKKRLILLAGLDPSIQLTAEDYNIVLDKINDIIDYLFSKNIGSIICTSFTEFPNSASEGKIILLLSNAKKINGVRHISFPNSEQTAGYYIFKRGIWWRLEDVNTASGTFFPPTASGNFR